MMMVDDAIGWGTRGMRVTAILGILAIAVGLSRWTVQADEPSPVGNEPVVASPQGQSETVETRRSSQPTKAKLTEGKESPTIERTQPAVRVAALPRHEAKRNRPSFNAPVLKPMERLGANDSGVIAIRVNRLLKHPILGRRLSNLVDPVLDAGWKVLASDGAASRRVTLGMSLENIDHVIGLLDFSFSKKKGEPESDKNSTLSLAMIAGLLRLNMPVNHDAIRNAIHDGPVAELLDNVFVDGAVTNELVLKRSVNEYDSTMLACIQRGWQVVDGGMVTASIALPKTLGHVEDARDQHVDDVLSQTASMAVGVDVQDVGPAEFRAAFVPGEGVTSDELLQTLTAALELLKSEIASAGNGQDVANQAVLAKLQQTFDALRMKTVASPEGSSLECVEITFRVPLEVLMLPLQFKSGQGG